MPNIRQPRSNMGSAFTLNYPKERLTKLRIVVSAKVTKKATERNLVKRRIKVIWQELHPNFHPPFPVIYVYAPALKMSFAEMRTAITKLSQYLR